jgi:uncharacterized protein (TIGR03118 family)
VPADNTDPNLIDGWGVAFNPDGFVWVNSALAGKAVLCDGNGVPNSLVVSVPAATGGGQGIPTGIVFSSSADFAVTNGVATGPSRFIFASLTGSISGWAPNVDLTNATSRSTDPRRARVTRGWHWPATAPATCSMPPM